MKQHFLPGTATLALAFCLAFSARGQFAGPHLLPPSNGLEQYLLRHLFADFDADGLTDLLTVKQTKYPGTAYYYFIAELYRNDGAGGFEPPQSIGLENDNSYAYIDKMVSADLDGNGFEDIIYQGSSGPFWQANYGNGNFSATMSLSASFSDWGDLDEDGDTDLMGYSFWNGIHWTENDGNENFQTVHPVATVSCCFNVLRLVDLNGDNRLDILTLGDAPNVLRWYPNLGGGSFGTPITIASALAPGGAWQAVPADVDGDGDSDLIGFTNLGTGDQLLWWANDGAGNFSAPVPILTATANDYILYQDQLPVADFTNDGAPDILALTLTGNSTIHLTMWINNGSGQFARIDAPSDMTGFMPGLLDLDADGFLDWALQIEQSIFLGHNAGNGTFDPMERIFRVQNAVRTFDVDDLNEDATPDFLYDSYYYEDGLTGWHSNNGLAQFGPLQQLTPDFENYTSARADDLDGDNDADLVFTRDENIWWRVNDGTGNFGPETLLFAAHHLLGFWDLDGDGDLDMVVVATPGLTWGWLENDGSGVFSNFQNIPYAPLSFSDFDGDGDLDLFHFDGNGVARWYANNGAGSFATDHLIGAGAESYLGLSTSDLDGDSDQDVLFSTWSTLRYFANQGGGVFDGTATIIDPDTEGPLRALAADFDQDGDNDVVAASAVDSFTYAPGKFAWYENLGAGVFAAPQHFGDVADAAGLRAVDLDADGDLELIWHSAYDIGWWDNLHGSPYISGACFWDKNENKIRDAGEPPALGVELNLQPSGLSTFVLPGGEFKFYVSSGEYTLSYDPNACWELTTDSAAFHLNSSGTTLSGYQFGFKRSNDDRYVSPIIAGGQPRCDADVPFWVSLDNQSCNEAAGRVALVPDNLVSFVSSVPAPAAITGDTLWWDYDTIQPFGRSKIELMLHIADASHVGDTIHLQAFTWLDEPNGSFTFLDSAFYRTEIRCSFDPNDKMVDRPAVPNDYTSEEHELIYTIRFQNTGNDTAFLVRLRDTLSADLDWTTLRPLGSSHPYYVVLNNLTGLLQFTFEDIILPDSATNPAGSQGFVQFAIQLQPGLPPGTVVPNRAGIYFDANPVVPTNTAETRVLLPVATHSPAEQPFLLVRPNPTTGICTALLAKPTNEGAVLELMDTQGRILHRGAIPAGTQEQKIDLGDLPAGLYLVKLTQTGQATATAKIVRQ